MILNDKKMVKRNITFIVLVLLFNCVSAYDCADTEVRCVGSGKEYSTIQSAANAALAGDTVVVFGGTYEENVNVVNDGSAGNEITYVANVGDTATVCGWDLYNRNNVRIIGFNIDNDYGSCTRRNGAIQMAGSNSFIEIWNNNLRDARYNGIRMGVTDSCSNCLIIGNRFEDIGFEDGSVGTGSGNSMSVWGDNNLIAYNFMTNMDPDNVVLAGDNIILENNYGERPYYYSIAHADFLQHGPMNGLLFGLGRCTFEANFYDAFGGIENGHSHVAILQNYADYGASDPFENIFRGNVFHDIGSGDIGIDQCGGGTCSYYRIYHNTFADSCVHSGAANTRYGTAIYGAGVSDTYLHNNIYYETWGDSATSNIEVYYVEGGVTSDYNLAYDPDGPVTFYGPGPFANEPNNQENADPGFLDYDNDEFHITDTGGAYNNAGPLTHVNDADGTGTTFDVDDAGFFRGDNTNLNQYGGNLVVGDTITVGTDTLQIAGIDYAANEITVTQSFTWADNEPVYWGSESSPDIGALPYNSEGYALTAEYSIQGNTVTVTPSDLTLVRFVVVYEDNVPVGVVSEAPYSVSGVGTGDLEVRVYPLYAGEQVIVATDDSITPECSDGIDNDGDGSCDTTGAACTDGSTPGDTGCDDSNDNDETDCGDTACEGGEDCDNCPDDCPTGVGEICCSGVIYEGDCCSDTGCVSPETCINNTCTASTCSPADSDSDGEVSINELQDCINQWKMGEITITELMTGISEWKNGCS